MVVAAVVTEIVIAVVVITACCRWLLMLLLTMDASHGLIANATSLIRGHPKHTSTTSDVDIQKAKNDTTRMWANVAAKACLHANELVPERRHHNASHVQQTLKVGPRLLRVAPSAHVHAVVPSTCCYLVFGLGGRRFDFYFSLVLARHGFGSVWFDWARFGLA